MLHRKKRVSHSSQRNGRLNSKVAKTISTTPLVLDLWILELWQFGQVKIMALSRCLSRQINSSKSASALNGLLMPLAPLARVRGMAVGVQPRQKAANAAVGQRDAGIRGAIIQIDGVAIGGNRVAAGKHHVLNIAVAFVLGLRSKHPGISAIEAFFRLLQIKQSQAEA